MGTFYFLGLVSVVAFILLIRHEIKLYHDTKEFERLKQRLEHKLNREDWILHDLTSCRED